MTDRRDPVSPTRRTALLGLGAVGLAGCAPSTGIEVTRDDRNPMEGGIGGTGIVGVLTDFGSLIVNGRRLLLTSATRYEDAFGAIASTSLRRGHSLTVDADGDGQVYRARRVTVSHPLIGPAVAAGPGLWRVNGISVRIPAGIPVAAQPGRRVAVSGLWVGAQVVASRIDPAEPGPDVIAGAPSRDPSGLAFGGVSVRFASVLSAPAPHSYVTLQGTASPGGFSVMRSRRGRFRETGRLRLLSVEGFLEPISERPGFRVSGLGHSFDADAELADLARQRSIIEGAYDGDFVAARGIVLPTSAAERQRFLRRRLSEGVPDLSLR